ncbi:MAG TPA: hypothetical protein VFT32_13620 [Candidatus Eisenbacteria bacterium]|nr:hypothetical protein [Candidatus Eisenbacteria bacterium]
MNLHLLPPVLGCLGIGLAASAAAPATWGIGAGHGLLLGGALYAGGLRRFLAQAHGADRPAERTGARLYGGAALRVAAFLFFAAFQAIAYFEWLPGTDLRWTFVVLSTWVTIETLMEPRAPSPTASSPRD